MTIRVQSRHRFAISAAAAAAAEEEEEEEEEDGFSAFVRAWME
jgi:hypothetical protein